MTLHHRLTRCLALVLTGAVVLIGCSPPPGAATTLPRLITSETSLPTAGATTTTIDMTVTAADTPVPTAEATATVADTIVPTAEATVTAADTPVPTAEATATVADTIVPTVEMTPTAEMTATAEVTTTAAQIPAFKHIFTIVLENKEDTSIVGNDHASYLNSLIAQYASATNYHGIRHPSLPNYLALTGGDTFGITSDCTDCFVDSRNIIDQLEESGHSWKAYMESMPSPCFVGNAAPLYRQKHNPFIYYNDVRSDKTRCNKIVPFTQFSADIKANTVPDYAWITPNMCNDMHDCSVKTGDTWLKRVVPTILASDAWKDNGVLFITFDEGGTIDACCQYAAGGKITTLVISPLVQPGFESTVPYDHYSLLHTVEAAWGLPPLRKADCNCSPVMSDFFVEH